MRKKYSSNKQVETLDDKKAQNVKTFERLKKFDAVFIMLTGLILILISIICHTTHIFLTSNKFLIQLNEIVVQFLSHIGIGLIAVAIITILLDMGHWTAYFEKRLVNIVTEKQHLEKLEPAQLINLQTEVLKAYFKNDQIAGTDGFLNFYQKNIQNIIDKPFRTNVSMNLRIDFDGANKNKLRVHEVFSYTCKANSGKIQTSVCYMPEEDENFDIVDVDLILKHKDFKDEGKLVFTADQLVAQGACKSIKDGFKLDITKYNYDGLRVDIIVDYFFDIERFFSWRMSEPSRYVRVSINFPIGLTLQTENFFKNDDFDVNLDETNGSYSLSIEDWVMPDEGLACKLIPEAPSKGTEDSRKKVEEFVKDAGILPFSDIKTPSSELEN